VIVTGGFSDEDGRMTIESMNEFADTLLRERDEARRAGQEWWHAVVPLPASTGEIAALIDHTSLKADTVPDQIRVLCREAKEHRFASVCVNSRFVPLCVHELEGSGVPVAAVVGFPLGASSTTVKVCEAEDALRNGARELDLVIPVGLLKAGLIDEVFIDIAGVVEVARRHRAIVKVIIEACYLTDREKIAACLLSKGAGADFVKTSTGFGPRGATPDDVALMRKAVGPSMGVKAAGGIRTKGDLLTMVRHGANRIGASASVQIVGGSTSK